MRDRAYQIHHMRHKLFRIFLFRIAFARPADTFTGNVMREKSFDVEKFAFVFMWLNCRVCMFE